MSPGTAGRRSRSIWQNTHVIEGDVEAAMREVTLLTYRPGGRATFATVG